MPNVFGTCQAASLRESPGSGEADPPPEGWDGCSPGAPSWQVKLPECLTDSSCGRGSDESTGQVCLWVRPAPGAAHLPSLCRRGGVASSPHVLTRPYQPRGAVQLPQSTLTRTGACFPAPCLIGASRPPVSFLWFPGHMSSVPPHVLRGAKGSAMFADV